MKQKHLATAALAAGAIASIATSPPPSWDLSVSHSINGFLDEAVPVEARLLLITVRGDEPALWGQVHAHLDVAAVDEGTAPARVRIQLVDDGAADRDTWSDLVVEPGTTESAYVALELSCSAAPCAPTFVLRMERTPDPAAPAVTLGGTVEVMVTGDGDEPPRGTEVLLEVVELDP